MERVARGEHLTVEIMEELVPSHEAAGRRRFPGSPTIRVEGRDLLPEVEARGDFGLG